VDGESGARRRGTGTAGSAHVRRAGGARGGVYGDTAGGCINSELKLSDREWTCDCGAVHDRDLNAAINLKNLAATGSSPGTGLQ